MRILYVYIPMIMRKENKVNPRQLMQVNSRIRLPLRRYTRTQMNVVTCV
jgi:hypothetical protein